MGDTGADRVEAVVTVAVLLPPRSMLEGWTALDTVLVEYTKGTETFVAELCVRKVGDTGADRVEAVVTGAVLLPPCSMLEGWTALDTVLVEFTNGIETFVAKLCARKVGDTGADRVEAVVPVAVLLPPCSMLEGWMALYRLLVEFTDGSDTFIAELCGRKVGDT